MAAAKRYSRENYGKTSQFPCWDTELWVTGCTCVAGGPGHQPGTSCSRERGIPPSPHHGADPQPSRDWIFTSLWSKDTELLVNSKADSSLSVFTSQLHQLQQATYSTPFPQQQNGIWVALNEWQPGLYWWTWVSHGHIPILLGLESTNLLFFSHDYSGCLFTSLPSTFILLFLGNWVMSINQQVMHMGPRFLRSI